MNYFNTIIDYAKILFSTEKQRRRELENSQMVLERMRDSHNLSLAEVLKRVEIYFSQTDFDRPLSPRIDREINMLARKYGIQP